jgi:hypothetical protein
MSGVPPVETTFEAIPSLDRRSLLSSRKDAVA